DLRDREKIACARAGARQTASAQTQLLPGSGARGYGQAYRARRRRHGDLRAEHGLPRGEREVEIDIVPAHPEQGMGVQRDIEIEVAVAATVDPLASLAGKAQALTVGGAAGNAHLELARDTVHEPVLAIFGHRELELDLGAVKSLLERDVDRDLVVLARHADFAPRSLWPPPSGNPGKKIRE